MVLFVRATEHAINFRIFSSPAGTKLFAFADSLDQVVIRMIPAALADGAGLSMAEKKALGPRLSALLQGRSGGGPGYSPPTGQLLRAREFLTEEGDVWERIGVLQTLWRSGRLQVLRL